LQVAEHRQRDRVDWGDRALAGPAVDGPRPIWQYAGLDAIIVGKCFDLAAEMIEVRVRHVQERNPGFGHQADQTSIVPRIVELLRRELGSDGRAHGDDLAGSELVARVLGTAAELKPNGVELAQELVAVSLGIDRWQTWPRATPLRGLVRLHPGNTPTKQRQP
jgi:hypothetical protein